MRWPGAGEVRWRRVIPAVVREYLEDDMVTYAAALAYHTLFALFPFLLFLVSLLGFMQTPEFFDWLLEQARIALPPEALDVVKSVVLGVQASQSGSLLSLGIATALWSASTGMRALMKALNFAYEVPEGRVFWKRYVASLVFTIGLALLMISPAVLLVSGPDVMERLAEAVGLGELFVSVWTWLRIPVLVLLLMLAAGLVYYLVPNVDQPFRLFTPGAILAVLAWILSTTGFSFYVGNFGSFDTTYGSIGGVIVLMLYFFISSNVLLAGAELNAEVYGLKHGRARPKETAAVERTSPDMEGLRDA